MHAPTGRDLRLDFFRGIALWLIFLDHIPSNLVAWGTIRNYGFSDATEIFVFVSGYTAAFVYGKEMRERGFIIAGAHILRRAWQIYVAHVFLFAIYLAEISYVATSFENPLYAEEMNILDFLKQPDVTIVQALLLKFKPSNMDVLPLYIILLLLFPPILGCCSFDLRSRSARRFCSTCSPGTSTGTCRAIPAAIGTSIPSPGNCCSYSALGARWEERSGSRGSHSHP